MNAGKLIFGLLTCVAGCDRGSWDSALASLDVPRMSMAPFRSVAPPAPRWRLVPGGHWQLVAMEVEDAAKTDATEGTRGLCPEGMVEVTGKMKVDRSPGDVEKLQASACSKWIDRKFPARCALFDQRKWSALSRDLPTRDEHFCIDRFEYPNRKGDNPVIAVSWREAGTLCAAKSKRLCTEDEWTFACEGEEALPYPNGYAREADACVVDRAWRFVDEKAFDHRDSPSTGRQIEELWQGEASGSRPHCRSPFGVYDMTGNVDEWTRSVHPQGYASILKGGYWAPVRAECRPSTRAHDEDFYFYQQSFRCCADGPAQSKDPPSRP